MGRDQDENMVFYFYVPSPYNILFYQKSQLETFVTVSRFLSSLSIFLCSQYITKDVELCQNSWCSVVLKSFPCFCSSEKINPHFLNNLQYKSMSLPSRQLTMFLQMLANKNINTKKLFV